MINNITHSVTLATVVCGRWILPLFLILLIIPFQALPQSEDSEYLLSENTYNAITKINDLLEANKHTEALDRLQSLQQDVQGNKYEEAVVQQTMGYAYNALERFDLAAKAFISAVESNALPPDVNHRLEYFIAQLLAQIEDYDRAIRYLEGWFDNETDPDINAYRLAAGLYYETGNHSQVIKYARAAISKSSKPDENLYQLLLASYFETKDYNNAADLLENMLQLFPADESYWKQLYSTYQLLNEDKRALAVYELAYRRGFLNKDEREQLARLYLHLQAPYRAARFLESEMEKGDLDRTEENLKLLAESYYLARETDKAIEAYGEAADLAGDGELYFRQGQLLVSKQRWKPAQAALQKALEQNTLQQRAQVQLLLGIAAYNLNNDEVASEALRQASQSQDTREQAEYWLQQIKERS